MIKNTGPPLIAEKTAAGMLGFLLQFFFAFFTFSLFNTEEWKLKALDILYWGKALCWTHHRSFMLAAVLLTLPSILALVRINY